MQTFEIPERDQDLHIIVKRPEDLPPSVVEQFVTRDMFLDFQQTMTSAVQKIMRKMTNIEELLQTIASQEVVLPTAYHHHHQVTTQEEEMGEPLIEVRQDECDPFEGKGKIEMIEEEVELHVDDAAEIFVHEVRENRRRKVQAPAVQATKKIKLQKIIPLRRETATPKMQYCEVESSREETVETITDDYTEDVVQDVEVELDMSFSGITIPVQSIQDLTNLNGLLERDSYLLSKFKQRMAELTSKSEGNFQRALSMLIADNVLFDLNWQGFKGKNKMSNMYIFSNLLYDEWFTHIDYEEYITQLKIITKKAHKRYAKTQERKRHRESGRYSMKNERDQVQEAIQTIVGKESLLKKGETQ